MTTLHRKELHFQRKVLEVNDGVLTSFSNIEKLRVNLQTRPDSTVYSITVLYLIYKTIEKNPEITVNRLKAFLQQEYFIPNSIITGSLASLVSPSLYGVVSRFNTCKRRDIVHLRVKKETEFTMTFLTFLYLVETQYKELLCFEPPKFTKSKNRKSN